MALKNIQYYIQHRQLRQLGAFNHSELLLVCLHVQDVGLARCSQSNSFWSSRWLQASTEPAHTGGEQLRL